MHKHTSLLFFHTKSNILIKYKPFILGEPSSAEPFDTAPQSVSFSIWSAASQASENGVKQEKSQHIYSDKEGQTGCSRSDVDGTPDIPVRVPHRADEWMRNRWLSWNDRYDYSCNLAARDQTNNEWISSCNWCNSAEKTDNTPFKKFRIHTLYF